MSFNKDFEDTRSRIRQAHDDIRKNASRSVKFTIFILIVNMLMTIGVLLFGAWVVVCLLQHWGVI